MQTPPPDSFPDTPSETSEVFDEPPRMAEIPRVAEPPAKAPKDSTWIYTLLLLLIILAGAFLRFRGIDWDEFQYVHPDERFLGFVENDIQPVTSWGEYFDTANSTLNPMNRGHGFFVYGTLPIFLLRYVMEWSDNAGYANFASVGRPLSGFFDLATILILYLIASRLFNRRVGLLAAAFSSFAVLQIQLSHFFTVDIYANFFIWLSLYFAVVIAQATTNKQTNPQTLPQSLLALPRHPAFLPALFFGLFSGMALASKVSAYPLVLMLPFAAGIFIFRQPAKDRTSRTIEMGVLMALGGALCLLAFRIFQPYAFAGPGFFDVKPNPEFVDALKSLQGLLVPSIGYPPAVQWIDRPVWFSGYNISAWGLGWPLALAAWAGMLWMGWQIFRKREFQPLMVVWAWTTGHFLWQSTVFNPTMRYQLPIYPGLALLGAWAVFELYQVASSRLKVESSPVKPSPFTLKLLPFALGSLVLLTTAVYAFAFSGIYERQVTRLEASRWMYANIPGAINLHVQTDTQTTQQPISFAPGYVLRQGEPFLAPFTSLNTGVLSEITLGKVIQEASGGGGTGLVLQLLASSDDTVPLATSVLVSDFVPSSNGDDGYTFALDQSVLLQQQEYILKIELFSGTESVEVCGNFNLLIQSIAGQVMQTVPAPGNCAVTASAPLFVPFVPEVEGTITALDAESIVSPQAAPQPVSLTLIVSNFPDMSHPLGSATREVLPNAPFSAMIPDTEPFVLDTPISLTQGETYYIQILSASGGPIRFAGTAIAVESSWDDPLPYRVDNYDPYGGIYTSDLNFEMYWFDDEGKRQRFYDTLDGADIVTISSNRQWGSVGRLSAVYPISSAYYRYLLGCPEEKNLQWCYNVAEPGMFQGQLGFELIQTFDSNPRLGPWEINDQFAEEAFTVYDHPKVFIFAKTADYDPAKVEALLGPLPLGRPLEEVKDPTGAPEAVEEVKSLLLTPERLSDQQNGGTWSELFNADSLLNTSEPLTILVWYGAVTLLGLITYPLIRLALPGLDDRGYPLARTAGMVILAYMVWLAGSYEIPVLRVTIWMAVMIMAIVGLLLGFIQSKALRREISEKWRYFLSVEGLTLAFFVFLLIIRMANPDLWHPWKGGEKPMDFAYLNAVIRSTTYPPYDPWFSGGYINYYYYGFVIVGVLVKWLGVVPAIAYNLILPTLFSMLAMGVFSIGWNLTKATLSSRQDSVISIQPSESTEGDAPETLLTNNKYPITNNQYLPYLIGLAAAIGITILGNLGTPQMILRGYERLGMPPEVSYPEQFNDTFFLTKWVWAAKGFGKVLDGQSLPYSIGDWYWIPSRAIPAPGEIEPITEFPFFTFLYADLHAHMMALPVTVLALAWVVAVVLGRGRWESPVGAGLSFLLAGIAIGALRPTNTWDFPTYLALGVVGWLYAVWRGDQREGLIPASVVKLLKAVVGAGVLVLLAVILYQPFMDWYALGYTKVVVWEGTHTPLNAYLVHWGLFLFLIVSWMVWETLDWMASTPISALRSLKVWFIVIVFGIVGLLGTIAYLMVKMDAPISWMVLTLALWAAILLFRPGMSDAKRLVLFLVGTGLVLTQAVEIIVLYGDINRMNTVFKFYIQVWVLFGVSAAASLGWLIMEARGVLRKYLEVLYNPMKWVWQAALAVMVLGAALFPLMAGIAKIKDRMAEDSPFTLNGQAYLEIARYNYNGVDMPLAEDYRAMQWLEQNVAGSPTIVEAQLVEYYWGSRFSINTGLPTVLGWNWHQRQQRTAHDADVWQRSTEVAQFYDTTDAQAVADFLNRYDVRYIVVGQLERAAYKPEGIAKFELWNGQFWHELYRDGQTVIYEVGPG